MHDDDDMADKIAMLPTKIELVGGPFCGVVLFPQHEVVTDVCALDTNRAPVREGLPSNFDPLSHSEIIFQGTRGLFRYIMESETKWSFAGEVEVQMS